MGSKVEIAGDGRSPSKRKPKRRELADVINAVLDLEVPAGDKAGQQILRKAGLSAGEATNYDLIIAAMREAARKGNVKAAQFLFDNNGTSESVKMSKARIKIDALKLEAATSDYRPSTDNASSFLEAIKSRAGEVWKNSGEKGE